MKTEYYGYLGGIFSVVAYVPYLFAIFLDRNKHSDDKTKCMPKRASWIIWITTSWIILATMRENAATFTIWQAWAYGIGASITFLVSIPYGVGGWRTIDKIYLGAALLGLILWWKFNSAWYAFALAIAVDGIGTFPVIEARGKEESPVAWTFFFLGCVANLFTISGVPDKSLRISNPNLADILYPTLMTCIVIVPTLFVWHATFIGNRKELYVKQNPTS